MPTKDLAQAWKDAFNTELNRLELNGRQRIFVVIEGEDERMVSLVRFLRASGVDITLLKYNFYRTASDEELLDFEKEVGEEDTGAQPTKAAPPSEEGLVQQWSQEAQQSYSRIRDKFTAAGLFGRAKKTGMSFSKQTRTGQVFVCFVTSSSGNVSFWLRSDTLAARFDFQATAAAISTLAPTDVQVHHTDVWFILTFSADPDRASTIADLILSQVASKLD